MILGTEARVRPIVEPVERGTGVDLSERHAWTSLDPRDRGPNDDDKTYVVASESM